MTRKITEVDASLIPDVNKQKEFIKTWLREGKRKK